MIKRKGGDVITVRTDASVTELLALLSEHRIGAVVVSDDGESVHGIVSERDIVRHLHTDGASLLDAPVGQIMTSEVHTATPDDEPRRPRDDDDRAALPARAGRGRRQARRRS